MGESELDWVELTNEVDRNFVKFAEEWGSEEPPVTPEGYHVDKDSCIRKMFPYEEETAQMPEWVLKNSGFYDVFPAVNPTSEQQGEFQGNGNL